MAVPRAFKTDESFLEKIAIGATGTRKAFDDLRSQGHEPMELERGSMSFKIWKAIKIKRVRVPDILCLRCAHRIESRAKTKLEITMSHSMSQPERGWDFGLDDHDAIALVFCERVGDGPLDWNASPLVQYIEVEPLRRIFAAKQVTVHKAKGAQEGFEVRITWPAAIVPTPGIVEEVTATAIKYRRDGATRSFGIRLNRAAGALTPLVRAGDRIQPNQIIAALVPVSPLWPCPAGATVQTYVDLAHSSSLSDRYAAAKALGRFNDPEATAALLERLRDEREHIYVRVDAAAGLMRRNETSGQDFLAATLRDDYLESRLEAAIVLGEIATPQAAEILISTLRDPEQHPEIRAGAAWSLGEVGARAALPALVESFTSLETVIKIEAARALAKVARKHLGDVITVFPTSNPDQRPGIAWALSKAGGFRVTDILPSLSDDDARQWVAYIIGTQPREVMLPDIEALVHRDPQVYFAVTVLWKIIASWVYALEEY